MKISPISIKPHNSVNLTKINKTAFVRTNTNADSITFSGKKEPRLDYSGYEIRGKAYYDDISDTRKIIQTNDSNVITKKIEIETNDKIRIKKITNYDDHGKKLEEITFHPNSNFVYNIKEFNPKSGFMKEQSSYENNGKTLSNKFLYNSKNGVLKEFNVYGYKNKPYLIYKMDPESGKKIQTIYKTIDGLYTEAILDYNTKNGEVYKQTSFYPDSNIILYILELDKNTGNVIKQTGYYKNGNMHFKGTANPKTGLTAKVETYSEENSVRISKTEFNELGKPSRTIYYKPDGKTIEEIEDLSLSI